jgi:Ca2+-binding RTX toxin-like protein
MTDVNGSNGADNINVNVSGYTNISTGNGNDTVKVTEAANGSTVINTGNRNDVVTVTEGVNSQTVINTGNGNDTVIINGVSSSSTIVHVGNGNDTVLGGAGRDTIYGGNGTDVLSGGAGNDVLIGGNGSDTLYGGAGYDTLYGGNGADVLIGGSGSDVVYRSKGADLGIYALADHTANDANIYDGGKGSDTLRLVVTQDALTATVSAKLNDYNNWLKTHGNGDSDCDDAYTGFQAFGLSKVTSWEKLQVEVVKTLSLTATQNTAATGKTTDFLSFLNSYSTPTTQTLAGAIILSVDQGSAADVGKSLDPIGEHALCGQLHRRARHTARQRRWHFHLHCDRWWQRSVRLHHP